MPKNPKITRADSAQINKRMFSEEHDAMRVIPAANVETNFTLSHADGDSIVAHKLSQVIEADEIVDAQHYCRVMAYSQCVVVLFLDDETVYSLSLNAGDCKEFCAIKLKSSAPVVVQ